MLYNLLKPLSGFWKPKPIKIHNNVFSLHGKFTVGLLIIFSLVISVKEYFGDPINCMVDNKDDKSFADYYCWIHGTYIQKRYLNGTIGKHIVSEGIGETYVPNSETDRVYQKYYQWVAFILLTLAIMLYIPYFLWKLWEGGRMKNVCQDFGAPVIASNWNRSEKIRIVKYLCQGNNESIHRLYAYRFMFCEILNMVMLIVAIWILNVVFDNFWIDYAKAIRSVFQRDSAGWAINTARIFPKLGKCTFHRFGPSGTVVNRDALCLLPLNIINEKVFAILWLWMLFLLAVSILNLIYKALIFFSHHLRIKILQSQSCGQKYSDIRLVTHNGDLGKWFFLYQMSRNVNPVIFCEIMRELFKYERDRMIYEKNHEDPEETI